MTDVQLRAVTAAYGRHDVLDEVNLVVPEGTTTAVLGGSGSGKTTLLRIIAGFMQPRSGEAVIGGRTVAGPGVWVPPERRGVGYVRQEGGLFPHLSVAGNIAFGLPWPRRRHHDRVLELLDLVGLPAEVADRRPDQLSGGQQQRVALARALAPRPGLVLLDEPFSSLDTTLRATTRDATALALRATGATAVLVTHDQDEALSFADQVAILTSGRIRQAAAPRAIYRDPVDADVAQFLGDAVFVPGEAATDGCVTCPLGTLPVRGQSPRGAVDVMLRPEQITLTPAGTGQLEATVRHVSFFGHDALVELALGEGAAEQRIRARVVGLQPPEAGDRVGLDIVGPVRAFPSRPDRPGDGLRDESPVPSSA
ncbi:ABC transporter ATP-binding protein [Isoptericola sp. 178]|uniref:ABC transporter ATP-binding protein n=1 Tax=Isoptericola sp. 178 TaxID=3064651 RepID=UPI0027135B30|nr:ABC transporter ATP-binding protein [Isoptericola sp. 178]MDO8145100.1 ABC transporter ATP-binding protein [Isoptericola sp. 178]